MPRYQQPDSQNNWHGFQCPKKKTLFVSNFPTKQPFTSLREPEAHAQIEEQYGSSERRIERLAYKPEQLTPSFQRK
jgi:hypothetical protein